VEALSPLLDDGSTPGSPAPGSELVTQAVAGEPRAYGRLVEAHWVSLVRLARAMVGDADAEDVVQDALVHAWGKLQTLRDPQRFPAWIARVVARTCLRHQRRHRFTVSLAEASGREERTPEGTAERPSGLPGHRPGADPAATLDPRIDLRRTLAALAPRQRAVLHLTIVEGRTDSEIAELLGITAASVRSHRRRARQRLAKLWRKSERRGREETQGSETRQQTTRGKGMQR